MIIFPAIDLKNGEAVRLTQGDYNKVKVYFKNPEEVLGFFKKNNSRYLHIVDLDGASSGKSENFDTIKKLVENSDLFIQVGGGIRNEERIKKYLDLGVNRIILGTAAIEKPEFLVEMVHKYKEKIAVSVDARDQKVAVNGWKEVKSIDSLEFCKTLSDIGVDNIIYTDISRDGKMNGTNLEIYKLLSKEVKSKITASGGITYKNEISELKSLNIYGAIVGKAIYENTLNLEEIIKTAE
jgi:phosphoribosylformimino-5-aminoimidazole carboxamide ribotide isomerase